jgi:uncharacterized BrkB/YihY/UPF0761 family membrane protein
MDLVPPLTEVNMRALQTADKTQRQSAARAREARARAEIVEDRLVAVAAGVVYYALLATFPRRHPAIVPLYGLFTDATTINEHCPAAGLIPASPASGYVGLDSAADLLLHILRCPALFLLVIIGLGSLPLWTEPHQARMAWLSVGSLLAAIV